MATQDVPGANPRNADELAVGCWAEHEDGSLIFVKGVENGRVVYELFDLQQDPPMSYTDAMPEAGFKKAFSFPPIGRSAVKWTWHDKTTFPWDRVMQSIKRPRPMHADVEDQLSAAQRVAQDLDLRGQQVREEHVSSRTGTIKEGVLNIMGSIAGAIDRIGRSGGAPRQ